MAPSENEFDTPVLEGRVIKREGYFFFTSFSQDSGSVMYVPKPTLA